MQHCAHCGKVLSRARRRFWERPVYAAVYRCRDCDALHGDKHELWNYLSGNAKCPRCGSAEIHRRGSPDRIDRVLHTPLSAIQHLLGGRLYHCLFCRIQFYDVRRRGRRDVPAPKETVHS